VHRPIRPRALALALRRGGPALALVLACSRGTATEVPEPAPLTVRRIPPKPEPTPVVPEGPLRWRGQVMLPVGSLLEMFVELRPEAGAWAGTISIPAQSLFGAPLGEISVADGKLSFSLVQAGARWTAKLEGDGTVVDCVLEQRGTSLDCMLAPIDEATLAAVESPARPQTPVPPFPYDALEVGYDNETDGVHLAGTLTMPDGPGPFPAALLVTGSGAQDRDEALLGHKPFLVLADHLTRQGIAVLRVDDRGVGGSTGDLSQATGEALARDAAAGLRFLRGHERIDPARVGIVGHSEGGVIGPRVAADDPKLAFVVMMAGTGVSGLAVIREQSVAILRANSVPAAAIELARHQQAKALQVVIDQADVAAARRELEALGISGPQAESMLTPWFRSFVAYDPAPALTKLRCPVLVLNGELDLQVLPDQNLPVIEKALAKNRRRVTVHRLPGLNHLFQHAKTGSPEEYAAIEETLAPEVLAIIGDWIVAQTAKGRGKAEPKRPPAR
jgi:pimeloyl-ACP methyl ester carboxylesterase